jgi:N,N'-diacetyllegionaminate synthase
MPTLLIAEAGVNHNGDIDIAKKLVQVAAQAGADFVKFQTFNSERLVTANAKKAPYQISPHAMDISQQAMLKELELSESMHQEIIAECRKNQINFLSTGFDIESVEYLATLNPDLFKIPSGEITNLPYLRYIGSMGKPIIMSSGLSNMHEIAQALEVLENSGTPREKITVLHCTSAYPAPYADVNLAAMLTIKREFQINVGYSDHTTGTEVAIAAVGIGASVIEKHFTLDREMQGPDHAASLEPDELKSMVLSIRNIEIAMGDGVKVITKSEIQNIDLIRKSIVAKCDIKKGQIFSNRKMIYMLRSKKLNRKKMISSKNKNKKIQRNRTKF